MSILCLVSLSTTSPAADPQCLPTNAPLDGKLNRMADFLDLDDDGLISTSEITHDLNPVDSNKDGFITEDEALTLYKCAFGETEYNSRFIFNQVSQGAANISTDHFAGVEPFASGIPRAQFITLNRDR